MQIELLWIIPIVAFAFFVFLLIFFAQKRSEQTYPDLANEVNRFNSGLVAKIPLESKPDSRLNELEKSILTLTDSITNQQKIIDNFQEKNNENQTEVNDLRLKLRDLYKEYDIIVSENYSLRAKVKKLRDHKSDEGSTVTVSPNDDPPPDDDHVVSEPSKPSGSGKVNLRLYEDTRLLNMNVLEDTSEIDIAQVR